jgi:hypothetical protein
VGGGASPSPSTRRLFAIHPKNVYLSERAIVGPVNAWIGMVFDPEHRDEAIRRLLDTAASRRQPN